MSSRRQELEDSLSALTADVQRLKSKLNSTPTPTKQIGLADLVGDDGVAVQRLGAGPSPCGVGC